MAATRFAGTISLGARLYEIAEYHAEELPARVDGDLRTGNLTHSPGGTLLLVTYWNPEASRKETVTITLMPGQGT